MAYPPWIEEETTAGGGKIIRLSVGGMEAPTFSDYFSALNDTARSISPTRDSYHS